MTKEQIEETMKLPINRLQELAQTQEGFINVLSVAINFGRAIGMNQAHEAMNNAMRAYPKVMRS
jgi:galactose-1-phosphate uridylyltransferase